MTEPNDDLSLLLLSLGIVAGSLHGKLHKGRMIALLRSDEGERIGGYLRFTRDALADVLRESGREARPPTPGGATP